MYICNNCGNTYNFAEMNVIKTIVLQDICGNICSTTDKFIGREDVVCLKCEATLGEYCITEK